MALHSESLRYIYSIFLSNHITNPYYNVIISLDCFDISTVNFTGWALVVSVCTISPFRSLYRHYMTMILRIYIYIHVDGTG